MAAGLLRKAAGDRVIAHSAGTNPGTSLNAQSAASLAEIGADMSGGHPKPIDPDLLRSVDLVVTLDREATVEVPDGRPVAKLGHRRAITAGHRGHGTDASDPGRHRPAGARPSH